MVDIELEDLTKTFDSEGGEIVAVDSLDLKIQDGEFFSLVGPSGCGKTTTLRMIAGLEVPSSGHIYFDEQDVTDLSPQSRDIAMVFQNIALFPHMTCRENIGYGLKVRRDTERKDERIQEIADILSISDQLDKNPDQLSGGQQQRVALGRAIIRNPGAILFDEPMSDLDAKLKAELRVEVQKLQKEYDTTMIYVTHDQKEAMTMSDRIGVMNDGVFEQVGTPEEIYGKPANEFVGGFIGDPAMNFFNGRVESDMFYIGEPNKSLPLVDDLGEVLKESGLSAERRDLRVGTRPSHINLTGSRDGEVLLNAEYQLAEPNGEEYIVYLDFNGEKITAISESKPSFEYGTEIGIKSLDKCYLFDPETSDKIAEVTFPKEIEA